MPEWLDGDPVSVDDEIAHWEEAPRGSAHQFDNVGSVISVRL